MCWKIVGVDAIQKWKHWAFSKLNTNTKFYQSFSSSLSLTFFYNLTSSSKKCVTLSLEGNFRYVHIHNIFILPCCHTGSLHFCDTVFMHSKWNICRECVLILPLTLLQLQIYIDMQRSSDLHRPNFLILALLYKQDLLCY